MRQFFKNLISKLNSKKQHRQLFEKAINACNNKDYANAETLFKQLSEITPNDSQAYFNWGCLLYNRAIENSSEKDFSEGCKKFQQAAELDSKDFSIFYNWGLCFYELAKIMGPQAKMYYQSAYEKFSKALELESLDYLVHFYYGFMSLILATYNDLNTKKYFNTAFDSFCCSSELNPQHLETYVVWAEALWYLAETDKISDIAFLENALEKIEIALQIDPNNFMALNCKGVICFLSAKYNGLNSESDFKESLELFQRSLDVNSNCYPTYVNLGTVYLYLKQKGNDTLEKAKKMFLKAERIFEGSGAYNLACLNAIRNNENKCQEWLQLAEKKGTLQTRRHAMQDEDLASVRDKEWFQNLKWKNDE